MTGTSNPPEQRGHNERAVQEFLLALGGAIASWQKVEKELFHLYMVLCRNKGDNNLTIVSTLYHATVHLNAKLQLIDALVELRVKDKDSMKRYATVKSHVKKRQRTRDKLAHWTVVNHSDAATGEQTVVLSPPLTDGRNLKDFMKPSSGVLRINDLHEHTEAFFRLSEEVKSMWVLLAQRPLTDI